MDPVDYKSSPTLMSQARIKYLEEDIIQRSPEFLADPDSFIDQWESLTDEDFPQQYLDEFPLELSHFVSEINSNRIRGWGFRMLPLLTSYGAPANYPEERLVENYTWKGQGVYVLKDAILKELTTL